MTNIERYPVTCRTTWTIRFSRVHRCGVAILGLMAKCKHSARVPARRDPLATPEPARQCFRRLAVAALESLDDRKLNLISFHIETHLRLAEWRARRDERP